LFLHWTALKLSLFRQTSNTYLFHFKYKRTLIELQRKQTYDELHFIIILRLILTSLHALFSQFLKRNRSNQIRFDPVHCNYSSHSPRRSSKLNETLYPSKALIC